MADKRLKKLSRIELLQIMLEQGKEIDRLKARVEELEAQLEDKRIKIENAGSIAEAAVQITDLFENAQKAADRYLKNVRDNYLDRQHGID